MRYIESVMNIVHCFQKFHRLGSDHYMSQDLSTAMSADPSSAYMSEDFLTGVYIG